MEFSFSKVRDVKSPNRAHNTDAGIDLFIPNDFNDKKVKVLKPHENILIPSGIHFNIPEGYALIAFNKSGISSKLGLMIGACVVDQEYQGEVHINLINTSDKNVEIFPGMKIIQFILIEMNYLNPVEVDFKDLYLEKSTRGAGGFGSTSI